MGKEIELTDATFITEIQNHKGVAVVDFSASWCGPCKAFAPAFAEFAAAAPAGVKVAKADVDQCPQAAAANGVMSVPTVAFFKDGEAVDRMVGVQRKDVLLAKAAEIAGQG